MSSRLTVAIHILTALTLQSGEPLTSERIAESVNTNSVVIRRILGLLRAAGFVDSKTGVGGGWVLRVDPSQITLLDVLRVVEPQHQMFALHHSVPNQKCVVGCNIQKVLTEIYDEAWECMAKQLAHSTIASVSTTLQGRPEYVAGEARDKAAHQAGRANPARVANSGDENAG